ncbi:Catechol-2,3-dioxygenase [Prauserella aidingensis]|uniref:VOC family protein n=1 Tax=Prauserella aidingensis TaxID=387890 RepID=UPI0020A5B9E3|nr:VOC family protein [Prauserella aidingensis]MCP2256004.1 Catechol-2,3-dioxygenase [Prauserella aidingensis]
MPLHRLTGITIGVPNVSETADYYTDFGLTPSARSTAASPEAVYALNTGDLQVAFSTVDGGEQLRLVRTPRRRLVELGVGVDDPDDLDRIAASLAHLELTPERDAASLTVVDPGTGIRVTVEIAERIDQAPATVPSYNSPGIVARQNARADGVERDNPVRPRKLGHVVLGSTDQDTSQRFFTEGIGFKISDRVPGHAAFMRCSTDHHNVLVQAAPVSLLHHTSWQVDDVDEVGRGATSMLAEDPTRHVWGLGRHHIGSNFFWYLKDPAGNFSEYYSDIDCIVDDQLWTPQDWHDARALYSWGPPPPPSFLKPDDLAELMTDAHAAG